MKPFLKPFTYNLDTIVPGTLTIIVIVLLAFTPIVWMAWNLIYSEFPETTDKPYHGIWFILFAVLLLILGYLVNQLMIK